ncbi:MAG: hypothetical protein HZB42_02750 [Sphingobacteriales bacterium]|nr:hypothetical protein [Sphingobacteriales bacterium]
MKNKTFTPMGSMHPILFFVCIYVVALVVSVFICSSLFYSCNSQAAPKFGTETGLKKDTDKQQQAVALHQ